MLLTAYACEPERGSEPGVGWNISREMARYHDVWVITTGPNRDLIAAALARDPCPGLSFIYYDLPRWARWWKRKDRCLQVYSYLWQIGLYRVARQLHRKIGFDLAHHVTFVKYWAPSTISFLPIPFLWGPVGGGESAPAPFVHDFSLRGRLYEFIRDAGRWTEEHDPLVRWTARNSRLGIATTKETASRLEHLGVARIRTMPACGLTWSEVQRLRNGPPPPPDGPVRFISLGRLIHWKGFHLGLRAFALADLADCEYWIVGEGPERRRLETLSVRLGVFGRVRFCGGIARDQALRMLESCHVLVHPSLHDSGGGVCLEAMAAAKPVICLDLGGPALQVTEDTGKKVPAVTPQQAVQDLAAAMAELAKNQTLRTQMGEAGRERVMSEYLWADKADALNVIYAEMVKTP